MARAIFDVPHRPVIDLELARTPEEWQRGLSRRGALPRSQGMVFLYDRPLLARVWMKDTYFPLDVLFVAQSRVVDLCERLQPMSESVIVSDQPVDCMIEVHAGFIRMHGIGLGTRVLLSI